MSRLPAGVSAWTTLAPQLPQGCGGQHRWVGKIRKPKVLLRPRGRESLTPRSADHAGRMDPCRGIEAAALVCRIPNPSIAYGRMSWPGGHLGGPRTLLDKGGRQVFFDWIRENRDEDRERASGWSGVMTLPRVLSLAEDGTLGIEPIPELSVLRMNRRVHRDLRLEADSELAVPDVRGDSLELLVKMRSEGAREFGVKVRCSPDGTEQTAILCDVASKQLKVDTSGSTQDDGIRYHYYRNQSVGRKALERLSRGEADR